MARFSDEVINQIKSEVSLIRLVEASGVELKPHGKDFIGHCPFHNDKTPSLVVSLKPSYGTVLKPVKSVAVLLAG